MKCIAAALVIISLVCVLRPASNVPNLVYTLQVFSNLPPSADVHRELRSVEFPYPADTPFIYV